jgi:hypothetical protein
VTTRKPKWTFFRFSQKQETLILCGVLPQGFVRLVCVNGLTKYPVHNSIAYFRQK